MDKKTIYFERLALLADYLASADDKMIAEEPTTIIFHDLDVGGKGQYEVQYFSWIFEDMPSLSEDWGYNDWGQPVFLGDNCDNTSNSAFRYFGIKSPEVFRNLFCPYSQLEKYNGVLLSDMPLPSDVAKNIVQFMKSQLKLK
jgi:hypothetical protein